MRLWSLHPEYLDAKGLVALWREALLAKHVLQGKTKGYQFHPQLERFKNTDAPLDWLEQYLYVVYTEACQRGYRFDRSKLAPSGSLNQTLPVTSGQLAYEFEHLKLKLEKRCPEMAKKLLLVKTPQPHPVFHTVSGKIAAWEKLS